MEPYLTVCVCSLHLWQMPVAMLMGLTGAFRSSAQQKRTYTESSYWVSSLGVAPAVENHHPHKGVGSCQPQRNSWSKCTRHWLLQPRTSHPDRKCDPVIAQLRLFLTRQTVNKGHSTGSTLAKGLDYGSPGGSLRNQEDIDRTLRLGSFVAKWVLRY